MPDGERDHLIVKIPEAPAEAITCLPPANVVPPVRKGAHRIKLDPDSAGRLVKEPAGIIYYPPDEFNPVQAPSETSQISSLRERGVKIGIRISRPDGGSTTYERTLLLRRPPVVLVHGVNASATMWTDPHDCGSWLASRLTRLGFDLAYVDHGAPDAASGSAGELAFHGNGPIERAAELLDQTVAGCLRSVRDASPSFAIRRVDLVGHSYGGIIARWFLRMANGDFPAEDSRAWYRYATNVADKPGVYHILDSFYARPRYHSVLRGPCVRKLITIASPWRGTPIANYVNQTRAPNDPLGLRDAPIFNSHRISISTVLDRLERLRTGITVETRAPSMEVNAVESPWLAFLNSDSGFGSAGPIPESGGAGPRSEYGNAGLRARRGPKPFLDGVAYASLAGDNTAFLSESLIAGHGSHGGRDLGVDLYSLLDSVQTPSRFPYLALDWHAGSDANYSDGLVPLWSALPFGSGETHFSKIVDANHTSILLNDVAIDAVACWLSNRDVPTGRDLNPMWGKPIDSGIANESGGPTKQWVFQPGCMAPWPQSDLYGEVDGTARIKEGVFAGIPDPCVMQTPHGAQFTWRTSLDMDGCVTVYEYRPIDFAHWDMVEVATVSLPGAGKLHTAEVTGLLGSGFYFYKAISDYSDPFDAVLELQTPLKRFTPGP